MAKTVTDRMYIIRGDVEIDTTISGDAIPFVPGNTTSIPELCFEAEGGNIEDICATHNGEPIELSDKEEAEAHEILMRQNPPEPRDFEDR